MTGFNIKVCLGCAAINIHVSLESLSIISGSTYPPFASNTLKYAQVIVDIYCVLPKYVENGYFTDSCHFIHLLKSAPNISLKYNLTPWLQ